MSLAIEEIEPAAEGPPKLRLRAALVRALAASSEFTVVSNNCWGAHIYQAMEAPYATPFIGLFIPPADYLTLVEHFDALIGAELTFVGESKSASVNQWREREGLRYPIGRLGGEIEIDFQHYASEAEALGKWRRRCARINADPARRFFKFDDREGANAEHILAFERLAMANRVCFTVRRHEAPTIIVPPEPGQNHAPDGVSLGRISGRYFNALRWVSALPSWIPLPSLV